MVDTAALAGLDGMSSYDAISALLGISVNTVIVIFMIIGVWSLIWKGLSLWKSANKKSLIWFIVLLVFNTAGILDILYIYVFSKINLKKGKKESESQKPRKKKK